MYRPIDWDKRKEDLVDKAFDNTTTTPMRPSNTFTTNKTSYLIFVPEENDV